MKLLPARTVVMVQVDTPDHVTPRNTRLVYQGPMLRISRTEDPHGLVLVGELDVTVHEPLVNALTEVLNDAGDAPLRVNCAGVGFMDLGSLSLMTRTLVRRGLWGPILLDYLPSAMRSHMDRPDWPTQPRVMPGLRRKE